MSKPLTFSKPEWSPAAGLARWRGTAQLQPEGDGHGSAGASWGPLIATAELLSLPLPVTVPHSRLPRRAATRRPTASARDCRGPTWAIIMIPSLSSPRATVTAAVSTRAHRGGTDVRVPRFSESESVVALSRATVSLSAAATVTLAVPPWPGRDRPGQCSG